MIKPTVRLYCNNENDLNLFLNKFYNNNIQMSKENFTFENPMELIDLISVLVDNNDKYKISAWINLDEDIFIKITNSNLDDIIKYIYERYPY